MKYCAVVQALLLDATHGSSNQLPSGRQAPSAVAHRQSLLRAIAAAVLGSQLHLFFANLQTRAGNGPTQQVVYRERLRIVKQLRGIKKFIDLDQTASLSNSAD